MLIYLITALVLLLVDATTAQNKGPYTAEALADQITSLPGAEASKYPFGFSGYLAINGSSPGSKKMHYWLVESLTVPPNEAPVALWTNGGPGYVILLNTLEQNLQYIFRFQY